MKKISVQRAHLSGLAFVNLPLMLAWLSLFGVVIVLDSWWILVILIAMFGLSWLWWSWAVVKWRLWALRRVEIGDIPELYRRAVEGKLIAELDNWSNKTEFKSSATHYEETVLYLRGFMSELDQYLGEQSNTTFIKMYREQMDAVVAVIAIEPNQIYELDRALSGLVTFIDFVYRQFPETRIPKIHKDLVLVHYLANYLQQLHSSEKIQALAK